MGLCKTSNISIFTFINSNDLKFCTCSYSSCVYIMIRFTDSNGKVCKMMTSHFRTIRILHGEISEVMDDFLVSVRELLKIWRLLSGQCWRAVEDMAPLVLSGCWRAVEDMAPFEWVLESC